MTYFAIADRVESSVIGPVWNTSRGTELPGNSTRWKSPWAEPATSHRATAHRILNHTATAPDTTLPGTHCDRLEEDGERWDGLA